MPSTASIEVQGEAYCCLFLHACKHPTKAVNGLLLGTSDDSGIKVQKALPLFHSSFALSPMLEAALMLVSCRAHRCTATCPSRPTHLRPDVLLRPLMSLRRGVFFAGGPALQVDRDANSGLLPGERAVRRPRPWSLWKEDCAEDPRAVCQRRRLAGATSPHPG